MTIPNLRPRISGNACTPEMVRRDLDTLQDEIDHLNPTTVYLPLTALYGKATENWRQDVDGTGVSGVVVNPCNRTGSVVDTSIERTVYFKKLNDCNHDPNVVITQIIAYSLDEDGEFYCIDPAAWDDLIGTIKMLMVDNISQGWALGNGTANSIANGGTGITWLISGINRASPAYTGTAGELGSDIGFASHTHVVQGTTDTNTTGITAVVAAAAIVATFTASVAAAAIVGTIENHTCQQVVDCIADHDVQAIVDAISIDDHTSTQIAGMIADHATADTTNVTVDANLDGLTELVIAAQTFEHNPEVGLTVGHTLQAAAASPLTHEAEQGTGLAHTGVAAAVAAVTITAGVGASAAVSITDGGHTHDIDLTTDPTSSYHPCLLVYFLERINNAADYTP